MTAGNTSTPGDMKTTKATIVRLTRRSPVLLPLDPTRRCVYIAIDTSVLLISSPGHGYAGSHVHPRECMLLP